MPSNDIFLDETWNQIEPAVHIILGDEKNSSLDSFMYTQTYTKVYNYCTTASSKRTPVMGRESDGNGIVKLVGGELYQKLQEYLKTYLQNLKQKEGETFLHFYIRAWERYLIGSTRLNDVLDYINRYWVNKERAGGHREIYDILSLCLLSWRDYKFHANLDTLMSEIMEQIKLQRLGKIDSVGNLDVAIRSFVLLGFDVNDLKKQNLSVYINDFEKTFLTETHNFYSEESSQYINDNGVVNYVIKSQQRIDEELRRLEDLNDHTRRPLNEVLNTVLIQNHQEKIRGELTTLLDQERFDDIKRINNLLKRVPMTIPPMLEIFQNYIKKQGNDSVNNLKSQFEAAANQALNSENTNDAKSRSKKPHTDMIDPKQYIKTFLTVYNKFRHVVEEAFDNNEAFVKALDSACQAFINSNSIATPTPRAKSKTPELLAKYSDELLKKKSEDMTVDELMTIFKFLEDKESFETWYRRCLSKRLMGNTMSPEDEEKEEIIIQRLKTSNSIEYTNKITNMFTDIRVSRELGNYYKEAISKEVTAKGFINDLEPRILDSSAWSSIFRGSDESFMLPTELIKTQEMFTSLYQARYSGRQLNWIWNRSRLELKANLSKPGKPPYQFTVTLFQYAILSPYQDNESLTTSQLLEFTALPPDVFKANMIPFIKNKLLIQSPPGDKNLLKPTTKFTIIKEYTSKRIKVNFAIVKTTDSKTEEKETNEEIERRKLELLKAGIVRIMKARKSMKHESLTSEVYQIIDRFKPTVGEIKKAIEVLLDEQYLARNADGTGYNYLS